jgi:hypothetical protein
MPHFECGAFNHSATSPDQSRARVIVSIRTEFCRQLTARAETQTASRRTVVDRRELNGW